MLLEQRHGVENSEEDCPTYKYTNWIAQTLPPIMKTGFFISHL
jgi:hypothetical protein